MWTSCWYGKRVLDQDDENRNVDKARTKAVERIETTRRYNNNCANSKRKAVREYSKRDLSW